MKVLKISNLTLSDLDSKIAPLELDYKQASARRRILRSIKPFIQDIGDFRTELQKKYADKDKDGVVIVESDGQVKATEENLKLMQIDWENMLNEKIVISLTPDNERDWETIKTIVIEEQVKFIEKNKNVFNDANYIYAEALEEIVKALIPQEND